MTDEQVYKYLEETADIEGWFFPIDALLFGAIDEIQDRERISGNLFEIGVHHGKSAVLLARMLRDGEMLGVCDVFGQQDLNADHSGEGSRELFVKNLSLFAPETAKRVRIFAERSDQLRTEETTGDCRIFHIDGGHRPADVIIDLNVAMRALSSYGILALDDVFNPSWPGVSEGLYQFVSAQPKALVPLIIGGNKVFFSATHASSRYAQWLDRLAAGEFFRTNAFKFEYKDWLGYRVLAATRQEWVDLRPIAAAKLHSSRQSFRDRFLLGLLR